MKRLEGRQKPPASRAVDEALETLCAVKHAADYMRAALADGTFDLDEATTSVELIEHALAEAREVVPIAEQACQLVTLGTQFALYGSVTPTAIANAATVGIEPPTLPDAA